MPETQNHLNEKIERLQNQVNSLQDRIRDLETTLENSNYALSRTLKASEAMKIIQQGDSTLKDKKGSYLIQNDPKPMLRNRRFASVRRRFYRQVRDPTYREKEMESKSFSLKACF